MATFRWASVEFVAMTLRVLTVTFLFIALILLIVEFTIRAQVNRHLPLDRRIGINELQSPWVWLGRDGLLARHKRFYPESGLANIFRVLWVLFFAGLGVLIVYSKTTGSR